MNSQDKISNFILKEKLGKGSYGEVFRVMDKNTKSIYALKQIKLFGLKKNEIQELMKEANLLKSLNHNNIVKIEDSFQYDNFQKFGMLLEYCDDGDLCSLIKDYKMKNKFVEENKIIEIFKQILNGLEYLHSKKIIHRDIKTLNIFLMKDGRVKIGDLGIAKVLLYSSCANTVIGTPIYLAPEICEEKPYNEKSDIWSLGCVLYELITHSIPFNAPNYVALCKKISKGNFEPLTNEVKKLYSQDLLNLIDFILQKNPDKRPTVKEIKKYKLFDENVENEKNKILNNKVAPFPVNKKDFFNNLNLISDKKEENQKKKDNFNFDKMMRNKFEIEKNFEIKNKNIGNNIHINNIFNKQNLVMENNQNINPIDKFKIEVKKPVEFKNILIDNNNLNNNINNNNNKEKNNYKAFLNNVEKYKQNDCVNRYNNILGNLKHILEESKLNFKPKQNNVVNENIKKREIKSSKEMYRNNMFKNDPIQQMGRKPNQKIPQTPQGKKNGNDLIAKRVRVNPKGAQGDILSRQAQIARKKNIKNDDNKKYAGDEIMKKLDEFDKILNMKNDKDKEKEKNKEKDTFNQNNNKIEKILEEAKSHNDKVEDDNLNKTEFYINDKLSASAFFKYIVKEGPIKPKEKNDPGILENYDIESNKKSNSSNKELITLADYKKDDSFETDSLMIDDGDDIVFHDLLENSFNEENKDNFIFDLDKHNIEHINNNIEQMKIKSIELISESDFNKIFKFYKILQEKNQNISDSDNTELNLLIKTTVSEAVYSDFLEIFYKLAFYDCLKNLKESEKFL